MRRVTLLTNPDVCNLHCPLCFLNQRALRNCNARSAENGNGDCPPDNNRERRAFGLGEMPFEIAKAAIEKYAAERNASGKRLLREVIPSTMGEPLLYSHFDELLELCRALGIPLNLTTNGTFPGKWGSEDAMGVLLRSCRDIKVSYLASEQFDGWGANVEKLVRLRDKLRENARCATVSLQVTLHKKNLQDVPELVSWASAIGIARIKWNKVVLLKCVPPEFRKEYELTEDDVALLRSRLKSTNVHCEGSLFFTDSHNGDCAMGGVCGVSCPFMNEIWILPDGSENHCPDPERRFGM
jgi:organic radical activating enzyme